MGTMCTVTENNKLIAEFMGKKHIMTEDEFLSMEHKPHYPTVIEDLKYDSDWDWLMPVIDGILNASLPLTTDNPINQKRIEIFKNVNLYSSIDKVYNACVEFIKWYNK